MPKQTLNKVTESTPVNKYVVVVLTAVLSLAFAAAAQVSSLTINSAKELQLGGSTNYYHRIETSQDLKNWVSQDSYFLLSSVPYTQASSTDLVSRKFFRSSALPLDWKTMNNSLPDVCAEHDNVSVVMRASASSFWITATHPRNYGVVYYSACGPLWADCGTDTGTNYLFDNPQRWHSLGASYADADRLSSFWRPRGMTYYWNGIYQGDDIHIIQVGKQIPGTGEWPIYFVLYCDGYMRLIPFPPSGHPSVCFGSSVLIGPATISSRPYADIESMNYLPGSDIINLTFRAGGTATIDFSHVTRTNAIVKVSVGYPTDRGICTFRSNFVTDGNSDCDHVWWKGANGLLRTNNIMSFTGHDATNWFYTRHTRPVVRESSPDIEISLH